MPEPRSGFVSAGGLREPMIKVEHITKRYGATVAVNDVSFTVNPGEILGFLGPNGAGKSTTIKILTGYIVADEGKVTIGGKDALEHSLEVRQMIGYLPESTTFYSDMRVIDFLTFIARARQIPPAQFRSAIDRVVQALEIERMLKKNIGHLSKGYRQRVGLAQALIHDPPILIMDEPTSGLDPHQIIEIREFIRRLGEQKLVIFSSHILQEISAICSRILIIKDGKLVANGTPRDLQEKTSTGRKWHVCIEGPVDAVRARLEKIAGVAKTHVVGGSNSAAEIQVSAADGQDLSGEIFRSAKDGGWTLTQLVPQSRTLEDVYLHYTENR